MDSGCILFIKMHKQLRCTSCGETVDDHYLQIFFKAIDVVVTAIKDRSDQPSYKTFAALEMILLSVVVDGPSPDILQHLQTIFGDLHLQAFIYKRSSLLF